MSDDTSVEAALNAQGPRRKGRSNQVPQQQLKRQASYVSEERGSKRQVRPPTTPSPSPFQAMRVTKPDMETPHNTAPKQNEADNYAFQEPVEVGRADSRQSLHKTTMDCLTPRPTPNDDGPGGHQSAGDFDYCTTQIRQTEVSAENANSSSLRYHGNQIFQTRDGDYASSDTLGRSDMNAAGWEHEADEYRLDESIEEYMLLLTEAVELEIVESQAPPSSVVHRWDRSSRSASDYDPNLQHSSQHTSPELEDVSELGPNHGNDRIISNDLLDEDVDWDAVFEMANGLPKDPSLMGSREAALPPHVLVPNGNDSKELSVSTQVDAYEPLNPFTRPPFSGKAHDGSPIPGLSSKTVLRTCFRLGHLVNQATYCHQQRQDVVFELYARVTYSSREPMARKQHFQFLDLFKDQQPYITGILTGWRAGSLLDEQSHTFIAASKPKLCRCVCKMHKDLRVSAGWRIEIQGIQEVTWDDVRYAKLVVCGGKTDDADHQRSVETPKLP